MVEDKQRILDLNRKVYTLTAKLSVRECQYEVALEGLETIKNSNDPMGIAKKTIDAIKDCLPN
jgi:hypothetical protein|tara:strand:- start:725 stop:913 length:189 start_codon:yes stop_codon:yes gene_type:complete